MDKNVCVAIKSICSEWCKSNIHNDNLKQVERLAIDTDCRVAKQIKKCPRNTNSDAIAVSSAGTPPAEWD